MKIFVLTAAFLGVAFGAQAQLSVTTIGATDGVACYENANDPFSTNTEPCDSALRDPATSRRDRMKTFINRGIIHNRKHEIQAAIEDFNWALAIDDEVGEAYLNRGNSWYFAGRLDDALADYEKALALDVNRPWAAWYNIGLVYEAQGKKDEARGAYEKALELNPDFALAKNKLEQTE